MFRDTATASAAFMIVSLTTIEVTVALLIASILIDPGALLPPTTISSLTLWPM
ncbi:MAG: hypothetical protein ABI268_07920 [Rhodanobacter sp.]